MVATALGVLLMGATMGIHIEAVEGLPKKSLGPVLKRLKKGFEAQTGDKVKLDRKVGRCVDKPACIAKVKARTKANKVLFLVWKKGNAKANKLITTIVFENGEKKKIGVKIPVKKKIWDRLFPKLISKLLKYKPKGTAVAQASPPPVPGVSAAPPPVPGASAAPPVPGSTAALPSVDATAPGPNVLAASPGGSSFSLAPWITMAGGLVAGGAGVYFGLQSAKARSSALAGSHEVSEFNSLNKDIENNGMTANILMGTAGIALATGVVLFIID